MYWTSSCGRIVLQITKKQAAGASHPGPCDRDVLELSKVPEIARQLRKVNPEYLVEELRGYGAWDDEELADHQRNLQCLLWLACGDIAEEHCRSAA